MSSDNEKTPEQYAPKINIFNHDRFRACMRTAHDLGGEQDDGPIQLEERTEKQQWEANTYVTCECLAWRGVWNTVEKHRRHVDLGTSQYLSLPYYGRWLLSAARVLVDKEHVTLTELMDKMDEVKKRREQD
ncbi:MAG: hypothetical protein BMS9Abin26_1585 [Gammaproteobacteria bacterium]|nr:MAG: hypothetical protein BMS9Abin26_1585 [Gammaproteobacteria bacterium]